MAKSIEVVEVVRRNLGPAPASIMLLLVTVIVEASLLLRSVFAVLFNETDWLFAPYETPGYEP